MRRSHLAPLGLTLALLAAGPGPARAADAPVADAAERGDWAAVRALVKGGADVNGPQADGMTALHWAAYRDDPDAAKLLADAGADAKAANRYGVTPLSLACTNGSGPVVNLILDAGADPNTTLRGGETALMTAARTGKVEPVVALIRRGAEVDPRDRRGQSALMWAAADGNAEAVEALLHAGADFKTPLPSGFTPLAFAVREGRPAVVRLLLKAGADVNEAMQGAKTSGRSPVKGTTPLVLAIENGHFALAAELLDAGADPNDQRTGFTPLHILTWVRKPNRGDEESGDPAPVGSGGMTSLQFADVLVKHGADVNARLKRGASGRGVLRRTGASPFLLASMTADVPYMRALLALGADPKLPNADGCTPLMAAAGVGCLAPEEEAGTPEEALEAVKLTLELGNDVNAVDANGETTMHGAAYKSLPNVAAFLASHGADPALWNRKDKYGWTPLAIAEGHRPGNFKPSHETLAALRQLLPAGQTQGDTRPAEAASPSK